MGAWLVMFLSLVGIESRDEASPINNVREVLEKVESTT